MIRDVEKIDDLVPVHYAFISVSNKTGIEELVTGLFKFCPDLVIFSSSRTYSCLKTHLKESDPLRLKQLVEVAEYTGMPETEGGLVKTLHHKLFLGYLTETYSESHQGDLLREGAVPIDLVVGDLYPFSEVLKTTKGDFEKCRGNIDVGGPSALRAAAKNFLRVMVIPKYNPDLYNSLLYQLQSGHGHTNLSQRLEGFKNTFEVLSEYDAQIAAFAKSVDPYRFSDVYEITSV